MKRLYVLLFISVVHCGKATGPQGAQFRLEVSSGSSGEGGAPRITMRAGDTRLVQILVIGVVPGPVTLAAKDLPRFATLEGSILTLSPGRPDQGEYAITLIATSGNETVSTVLEVVVDRYNSPPRWVLGSSNPFAVFLGDETGWRPQWICPSEDHCTARGIARLQVAACDPEGDAITADVEVVRRGQPFSRQPNYSLTSNEVCNCGPGQYTCNIRISLPGLATDQSYDFAVRLADEFGATDGWVRHAGVWGFDQGPCTTRQCACLPTGSWCETDFDCCSGSCVDPRVPFQHCE